MKKNLLFLLLCGLTLSIQAQEYNLFDPADVDENGWLWFDTQEKINKYVSFADNENGYIDLEGKKLQIVTAYWEPGYKDTVTMASPVIVGAGTDKEIGGKDAKKGAILLGGADANMSTNGAGLIIRMPSCTSLSMSLSSDAKTYVRLLGTTDEEVSFEEFKVVDAIHATVFKPLFRGGQFTWEKMETLDSGNEPVFNLTSDKPIFAHFQSLSKYPIYIHGIRVMTSTSPSHVDDLTGASSFAFANNVVTLGKAEDIEVYNIAGVQVAAAYGTQMNLNNLAKGIYLVKTDHATHKVAID